jgi:hypothetical protein
MFRIGGKMKKLFILLFVLFAGGQGSIFAVNKEVVYDKDTKEIQGVVKTNGVKIARDISRKDYLCENDIVIYGTKTDKILIVVIDDAAIPADITAKTYKIDADKKEIFEEVILEEIK